MVGGRPGSVVYSLTRARWRLAGWMDGWLQGILEAGRRCWYVLSPTFAQSAENGGVCVLCILVCVDLGPMVKRGTSLALAFVV
jgi:hypothetical protein